MDSSREIEREGEREEERMLTGSWESKHSSPLADRRSEWPNTSCSWSVHGQTLRRASCRPVLQDKYRQQTPTLPPAGTGGRRPGSKVINRGPHFCFWIRGLTFSQSILENLSLGGWVVGHPGNWRTASSTSLQYITSALQSTDYTLQGCVNQNKTRSLIPFNSTALPPETSWLTPVCVAQEDEYAQQPLLLACMTVLLHICTRAHGFS